MKISLAVDPGMSGAIALYDPVHHDLALFRDFKSIPHLVNYAKAAYRVAAESYPDQPIHRIIEFVHAMPGQGVSSMFSFGKSTGAAFGALYTLSIDPIEEVTPQKWQAWVKKYVPLQSYSRNLCVELLYKPDFEKFDSRVYAVSAFPRHAEFFERGKDHNSADASLMALYSSWHENEILWVETCNSVWAKFLL